LKDERFLSFYGILLKKKDFGEANSILTILERQRGKIEISSFGSNKEKSLRRSSILTGHLVSGFAYRRDEGSLPSLQEIHEERSFETLLSDFKKTAFFFLLLELIDIITPAGENFSLFEMLLHVLKTMEIEAEFEKYALFFIIQLLNNEGILPSFSSLVDSSFQEEASYTNLGRGSLLFIRDSLSYKEIEFLKGKKVGLSVKRNLLDFVSHMIKNNYNRPIYSLSLIKLEEDS